MSFETALRDRLRSAPAVAALIDGRIDWSRRPQSATYPAITLIATEASHDRTLGGWQRSQSTRVQIDCMARVGDDQAAALRDAVLDVIGTPGTHAGTRFGAVRDVTVRDLGDDATGGFIFRKSIDATFWHSEET